MAKLTADNWISIGNGVAAVLAAVPGIIALVWQVRKSKADAKAAGAARVAVESQRLTHLLIKVRVAYTAPDRSQDVAAVLRTQNAGFYDETALANPLDANAIRFTLPSKHLDLHLQAPGTVFMGEAFAVWPGTADQLPLSVEIMIGGRLVFANRKMLITPHATLTDVAMNATSTHA